MRYSLVQQHGMEPLRPMMGPAGPRFNKGDRIKQIVFFKNPVKNFHPKRRHFLIFTEGSIGRTRLIKGFEIHPLSVGPGRAFFFVGPWWRWRSGSPGRPLRRQTVWGLYSWLYPAGSGPKVLLIQLHPSSGNDKGKGPGAL